MDSIANGSITELRHELARAAEQLAAAIASASTAWDVPGLAPEVPERNVFGDAAPSWTPRYAAYHALNAHWQIGEWAREVVRRHRLGESPATRNELLMAWLAREPEYLPLWDGLRDAASGVKTARELCRRIARGVDELDDADLNAPLGALGDFNAAYVRSFGVEPDTPATVRSWLTQMVMHLQDHAQQIRAAVR